MTLMSIKSLSKIRMITILFYFNCVFLNMPFCYANSDKIWHNTERFLRYQPDGEDFVITNGTRRFNRAIYGTNTGFRIEAGDLPEFALYMPGMGGNLKFGLISNDNSKWLIKADTITARYRPGSMHYDIQDSMLGQGSLHLTVLALDNGEGILVKVEDHSENNSVDLLCFFGGAGGKRFHRSGDIGADPESSFYLMPEYCFNNDYKIQQNTFSLLYNQNGRHGTKYLKGIFPFNSQIRLVDAQNQDSPVQVFKSRRKDRPVIACKLPIESGCDCYISVYNPETCDISGYRDIPALFDKSEQTRKRLTDRIQINTPDPYINTLGGALSIAADAIWENPSYLHGAVAWRSRLHGWRGIDAADPLGWHDRARTHFQAYGQSQYTSPASGPNVPDPEKNLARQQEKVGTALFTSGYISRRPGKISGPHHYDMNLVFIDALLRHFKWTGDIDFVREMWPVLERHLKWEKRCFDGNNDGLYDAYCCIWASDALQYSGGGATHSSAYNYKANKLAAELAERTGENPEPFRKEAAKILNAIRTRLWIPEKGWFAEYQDLLGLKRIHPSAGLWTVYHAIDSDLPDPFQAYQTLRYVDTQIPRIPIIANGLPDNGYHTLSTTNWHPYTWSINNVALAEVLHTTLAYWQAGQTQKAFNLWKSALLESMYLGASPGNFQQLSFYDAMRGELYRDFADPIGVAARTLVEGLFGINPDALDGTLMIRPSLPREWNHASLRIPDISYTFIRKQNIDRYTIVSAFSKPMELKFQARADKDSIHSVTVNNKKRPWSNVDPAVGQPLIEINCTAESRYNIEIEFRGSEPDKADLEPFYAMGETLHVHYQHAEILDYFDPQMVLSGTAFSANELKGTIDAKPGHRTLFLKLKQGQLCWWTPLCFEVKKPVDITSSVEQKKNSLIFQVQNYTPMIKNGKILVNPWKNKFEKSLSVPPKSTSEDIHIPAEYLVAGSNQIRFEYDDEEVAERSIIQWDILTMGNIKWEEIDLTPYFNDKVIHIFQNKYLSPRSPYPTLQLPVQGIGNWCSTQVKPVIDDSGLRKLAGNNNKIMLPQKIPFTTPFDENQNNIVFTSLWDNYPDEIIIPLSGKAGHAYFLMTGSTNPMQSRFTNGTITVEYTDSREECLPLKNPETWWPIEQDYYDDGFAFSLNTPKPIRMHLKTGLITRDFDQYISINGFTSRAIEGGAATVLDLPLNPEKELKRLKLKTTANDVVIGLMGITLMRGN